MGLIAPAFLLAAAAIALPLWLHRLQTQSSVRKPFSSAMLLESSEERVHVQRKLKYFLLLALRIGLLLLLALAFAKPFLERPPSLAGEAAAGTMLVVVDTSVSMNRAGVFSQARTAASEAIANAPDDVAIQLVAAADTISVLTEPSLDKAPHRAALANLTASAARLDFGELMSTLDRLATTLPAPVSLHFASDFQASGMPVRFADLVAPALAEFVPLPVGTGSPVNWSIELLRETPDGIDVQVTSSGTAERVADLELSVNGVAVDSRSLMPAPRQVIRFAMPELVEGDNRIAARLAVDDDLEDDNQRFHVVANDPPAEVPLITFNPSGLPVTYLSAALESAAANRYRVQTQVTGQFDNRILSRYAWLVIDDIGAVDDQLATALTSFLSDGGNVLAFAGDRAAALDTIPVTNHRHAPASADLSGGAFLSPGQVDTGHPVLSESTGWHNVNVSRSMPLGVSAEDRVLIRLENGDPFMIERRFGQGRLLLLLGGLDNNWNDLPVRPVFVSFIIEAAKYLSGMNEIPNIHTVAALLPLAVSNNISGQIIDPDGETVLSLADTTREQRIKLNKAGFYEVYTLEGETVVAANIDPLEAELQPITPEVLSRWRDSANDTGAVTGTEMPAADGVADDARLELWHWLLFAALLFVILESLLGNIHLAPRRQVQG